MSPQRQIADDQRVRSFVLTWNNYPADWEEKVRAVKTTYFVCGKEEAPTTGTPHIQGYFELINAMTGKSIRKKMPGCWAGAKSNNSTPKQAADYCKEDGDFIEEGTISNQGKRNDIEAVKEALNEGANLRDIVSVASSVQGVQYARFHLEYLEPKRKWKPDVVWIYGPSEAGKTWLAHQLAEASYGEDVYMCASKSKWWNGYDAHKAVIIDDFRDHWCDWVELLHILDRYEHRVEYKGGMRQLLFRTCYITCPYHPEQAYRTYEDKYQLMRRITHIVEFKSKQDYIYTKGNALPLSTEEEDNKKEEDLPEGEGKSVSSDETVCS